MRGFVAGAGGAIGRPLVGRLTQHRHEIAGMVRHSKGAGRLRGSAWNLSRWRLFRTGRSGQLRHRWNTTLPLTRQWANVVSISEWRLRVKIHFDY